MNKIDIMTIGECICVQPIDFFIEGTLAKYAVKDKFVELTYTEKERPNAWITKEYTKTYTIPIHEFNEYFEVIMTTEQEMIYNGVKLMLENYENLCNRLCIRD